MCALFKAISYVCTRAACALLALCIVLAGQTPSVLRNALLAHLVVLRLVVLRLVVLHLLVLRLVALPLMMLPGALAARVPCLWLAPLTRARLLSSQPKGHSHTHVRTDARGVCARC